MDKKTIHKKSSYKRGPKVDKEMPPDKFSEREMIEIGGVKGPEPTRYGDWEKNGRCSDF